MVRTQKVIFFGNITYRANDVNLKNINHADIWNDYVIGLSYEQTRGEIYEANTYGRWHAYFQYDNFSIVYWFEFRHFFFLSVERKIERRFSSALMDC